VLKIRHYAKPPNVMGKFLKYNNGFFKGLHPYNKQIQIKKSGDQNPLKKTGRNRKAKRVGQNETEII
jgi:hypothetical protein